MKITIITLLVLTLSFVSFAQKRTDVKCVIWETESFCNIPEDIYLSDGVFAIGSSWGYTKCEQIDSTVNLTGVWLTFTNNKKSTLLFKTDFENFKLIKKSDGKEINAFAIYSSKKQYISSITTKRFANKLKKGCKVNIIMLFSQAEKGDKIIIDNFIEAEIQ